MNNRASIYLSVIVVITIVAGMAYTSAGPASLESDAALELGVVSAIKGIAWMSGPGAIAAIIYYLRRIAISGERRERE